MMGKTLAITIGVSIIIQLVTIAMLIILIPPTVAGICSLLPEAECDNSVHVGAVIAFVVAVVSLVGTTTIALFLYWQQTSPCDGCLKRENDCLKRENDCLKRENDCLKRENERLDTTDQSRRNSEKTRR